MPAGAEIVIDHVSRTFPGGIRALDGVTFTVAPGQLLLLTGRSGAGKSTLLNLIAALDRPDEGFIAVDGTRLDRLEDPARYRRETVGYVFQLHHLLGDLSAQENVEVPLIPGTARHRAGRQRRALEALEEVGLAHRADHRPNQLSGGERQRVAVARALVHEPRILLADEPTASLDEQSAAELLGLLGRICHEHGTTIVLVSHDPLAGAHASKIVRLRDGRVSPAPRQGAAA